MQQSSHEMKARAKKSVGSLELTPQERRALAESQKTPPVSVSATDVLGTAPLSEEQLAMPGIMEFIQRVLALKAANPRFAEDVNLPLEKTALVQQMRRK